MAATGYGIMRKPVRFVGTALSIPARMSPRANVRPMTGSAISGIFIIRSDRHRFGRRRRHQWGGTIRILPTTIVAARAAFPPSGAVLLTMLLPLRRMRYHAE